MKPKLTCCIEFNSINLQNTKYWSHEKCFIHDKKLQREKAFKACSVIHPGKLWIEGKKKHINAHGGGILFHNGRYYWFGEHKSENGNAALVCINCYFSNVLVN